MKNGAATLRASGMIGFKKEVGLVRFKAPGNTGINIIPRYVNNINIQYGV